MKKFTKKLFTFLLVAALMAVYALSVCAAPPGPPVDPRPGGTQTPVITESPLPTDGVA